MTTHSSVLAWRIPWREKPSGLYSPWGCEESDTTERLSLLLQKTFQVLKSSRHWLMILMSSACFLPDFLSSPRAERGWEGKRGKWRGSERDTKGPSGTDHISLFIALLANDYGSFLSSIKTPIKDDNVLSLSFFFFIRTQSSCLLQNLLPSQAFYFIFDL